jgi:hypothetical protein
MLQRGPWLLGEAVGFQTGIIERATLRDRGEFIIALLDLDPALLRRQPPPNRKRSSSHAPTRRHTSFHSRARGYPSLPRAADRPALGQMRVLHDKRLPRSGRWGVREVQRSLLDEVLDEGEAVRASSDVFAEFGIERDGSLQQE